MSLVGRCVSVSRPSSPISNTEAITIATSFFRVTPAAAFDALLAVGSEKRALASWLVQLVLAHRRENAAGCLLFGLSRRR